MRQIKLVVSDFHIGTGKRHNDGTLNILEDFVFEERFIEFLEHHSTGNNYTAHVELIINGDFFNMIQGQINGTVPSDITEELACKQLQDIFDGHERLLDALKNFAETPDKSISFTIGNHDAGLIFPAAKQMLLKRIGEENVEIYNRAYTFDEVYIEHGDKYEPLHFVNPKLPFLSKGIDEPILNIPWATYFFIHYVRKLKLKRAYIDKVKPFRNYLTWGAIWDIRFFVTTFTRLVLFIFYTFLFAKVGKSRFGIKTILAMIKQIEGTPEMRAAKNILNREKVKKVIFGHTHNPVYRQWSPGKEYFNTGCWNGVTNLDIEGFGYQERLIYAYLKKKDGSWHTSLRRWKGTPRPFAEFTA